MLIYRTLSPSTDIKPDNILITIPESKKKEYLEQRYTTAQSKVDTTPSLPGSSLPIVLSRRIVPFPYDEVQNTFTLEPDFEMQLADFGTGEQGRFNAQSLGMSSVFFMQRRW